MHAPAPTHSPHKWLQSIVLIFWRSLQIHDFHHTRTHPSLSKLLESSICSFPLGSFFFFPMSIKHRSYSYLIHTFTNTSKVGNIKHTHPTLIIHNIPSINPHTSTRHPIKIITIDNLHKKNLSSFHHVYMGQTQTYKFPQDSVWEARMLLLWSWMSNQGPRTSSPLQATSPTHPWSFHPHY